MNGTESYMHDMSGMMGWGMGLTWLLLLLLLVLGVAALAKYLFFGSDGGRKNR